MVDTKTQRNKSDKDTIIDMEPVKELQKGSFFKTTNFIVPLISILFFALMKNRYYFVTFHHYGSSYSLE